MMQCLVVLVERQEQGPHLSRSKIARRNLAMVFPDKSAAEVDAIVRAMWDHLGRIATETAHLRSINCYAANGPVEVVGVEHLDEIGRAHV